MPPVTRSASKGLRSPPRPGADGTDGDYRMTIDKKYKQQAKKRAAMQLLAYTNAAVGLLLTVWQALPRLVTELRAPPLVLVLAATYALALAAYLLGSGTPRKESALLLRAYAGLCALLTLQVAVLMYLDARAAPDTSDNVHSTATWLHSHLRHVKTGTLVRALTGLDVFAQLLAALLPLACVFQTVTYLLSQRSPIKRRRFA